MRSSSPIRRLVITRGFNINFNPVGRGRSIRDTCHVSIRYSDSNLSNKKRDIIRIEKTPVLLQLIFMHVKVKINFLIKIDSFCTITAK